MNKVDSAFLIAAICGIWAELAFHEKDLWFGIIAGISTIAWLFKAISRWTSNKLGE